MALKKQLKVKKHIFCGRTAFTLVELVVALVILAALAHLALREATHMRDSRLTDIADRQLEEIRDAVYMRNGGIQATGFLCDMGRLPAAEKPDKADLGELWKPPEGACAFAVREAVSTNLAVEASRKALLEEHGVWVPTGWRGPYLRLPTGKDELLDPWGNPMSNPDSAGYSRLHVGENGSITSATHFGPSAKSDDPRRRTVGIVPHQGSTSTLTINISATETAGSVTLKWFGPASGMITGEVASVTAPGSHRFEGLTPGVRVLWDSAAKAPRFIDIVPGDNTFQLNLP